MQRSLIIRLAVSVFVVFLSYSNVYGDDNPGNELMERIINLRSPNISVRETSVRTILQDRQRMVAELKRIVQDSIINVDRRGTAKTAIALLGKLRSEEAIPLLVDNLTFQLFYKEVKRPPSEGDYPCIVALIEIGSPAIEPLMKKTEETNDELFNKLTAIVLVKVLNPRIAVAYLSDRLEHQADSIRRKRLTVLLQHIQSGTIR